MMLCTPRLITIFLAVLLVGGLIGTPVFATEQKMTIAITPPVFQVNLSHGDVWKSTVKVINLNPYALSIRVSVADMKKSNSSSFEVPIDSMEHWVDIPRGVLFLGAEKSIEIPFSVHVPYDAVPGGHYAFLLVGIEPEGGKYDGEGDVSSYVSSSLFVRVGGDIHEEGYFREFSTEKMFYGRAEVPFRIRFENVGNVHIRPNGMIDIYDVWGKKKTSLPVNKDDDVRVLFPRTSQVFSSRWKSDQGILETGFYRAEAQLRFGENNARVAKQSLYFFVVPFKEFALWILAMLCFLFIVGYGIRMYIRWALTLESRRFGLNTENQKKGADVLLTPFVEGIVDLRTINIINSTHQFTQRHKIILLGILCLFIALYVFWYVKK